jgi:hypothetical protein
MMPDWILPFREPHTEIKFISGSYYKYAVSYRYDSVKKRTVKVSGHLLGKITQEDGFVPSPKNTLRASGNLPPNVDTKTYGIYHLFNNLLSAEIASLRTIFGVEEADKLLVFAMMRFAHQSPIKRTPLYYHNDFCSQHWYKQRLSERTISQNLKFLGQNREKVVTWMRTLWGDAAENGFVMMDSTHIPCRSEKLAFNAKGYNPSFSFDKQIRLMYIFSSHLKQPVYYRPINGNIVDASSMPLCLEEFKARNVTLVADKGFFSEQNIEKLNRHELQYIIPLHRNNSLINVSPLKSAKYKKMAGNRFFYQKKAIWYWEYKRGNKRLVTFVDEHLRVNEENDYLQRIISMPEKYTQEKYIEKLPMFGTMSILHKTNDALNPQEIYETYKMRNEIEVMFDSYKNFLDADTTYMQDRYVMEGWLLANFIAMTAYYKLFARLKNAGLLSKYSPKDIVEMSKTIHMVKCKNEWILSETTKKIRDLGKKLGIDYLK